MGSEKFLNFMLLCNLTPTNQIQTPIRASPFALDRFFFFQPISNLELFAIMRYNQEHL